MQPSNLNKKISNASLNVLTEISEIFVSTSDLYDLANKIFYALRKIIKFDAFYIALIQKTENDFNYIINADGSEQYDIKKQMIIEDSIRDVILNKKAVLINYTELEYKEKIINNVKKTFGNDKKLSKSYMIAPIIYKEKIIGIISTHSYIFNFYKDFELNILSLIANQLAVAIKNIELNNNVIKIKKMKALIELIRNLTHKLNQPLTGITCYNSLIMEELNKNDKFYDELFEIDTQALNMEQLIKKIQKAANKNIF